MPLQCLWRHDLSQKLWPRVDRGRPEL